MTVKKLIEIAAGFKTTLTDVDSTAWIQCVLLRAIPFARIALTENLGSNSKKMGGRLQETVNGLRTKILQVAVQLQGFQTLVDKLVVCAHKQRCKVCSMYSEDSERFSHPLLSFYGSV
mmetsp:Transcript_29180/g.33503  ORF Transcript_29180/g.33503 Transcript_29180/m.33503 type:complete len:118 (+) Transcript_29180:1211-1564(+)